MISKLKNIKKSSIILLAAMIWWSAGILIFGDFSSVKQWVIFSASIPLMMFLIHNKWQQNNDHKIWGPPTWYSCMAGVFMSSFGLNPFMIVLRNPLIQITINSSFGIIGWWSTMIVFLLLARFYRDTKRSEYTSDFDNPEAYVREQQINKILGKWWR